MSKNKKGLELLVVLTGAKEIMEAFAHILRFETLPQEGNRPQFTPSASVSKIKHNIMLTRAALDLIEKHIDRCVEIHTDHIEGVSDYPEGPKKGYKPSNKEWAKPERGQSISNAPSQKTDWTKYNSMFDEGE
jgi:hypothetical protein